MGWQKGRPRKGWKAKTQAEPATEPTPQETHGLSWRAKQRAEQSDWRDESGDNLFSLSAETHAWLADHDLIPQWCTESVLGQPIESLMPLGDLRKYWEPVQEGDLPGFSGVERGGMRLHVRPRRLHEKVEEHHRKEATSRLIDHEAALLNGSIGNITLDPRHPSAQRANKIGHGYERISVPTDNE